MEKFLILEIRDHGDQLREWHKVRSFPAGLGRSFRNEVVIDDPFVCPEHLVIENGNGETITIRNLSGVNGTVRATDGAKVDEVIFSHGLRLNIGRTTIVFRDGAEPVPPAVPYSSRSASGFLDRANIVRMVLTIVVCVALAWSRTWLFSYYPDEPQAFLGMGLLITGIYAIIILPWVMIWSFTSLIFVRRSHFCAHVVASLLMLVAYEAVDSLLEFLTFGLNQPKAGTLLRYALAASCFFTLVILHLSCATKNSHGRNRRTALIITALVVSLVGCYKYVNASKFSSTLPLDETLKAPAFRVVSGNTLDHFIGKIDSLEAPLLEDAVEKSPRGNAR